MTLHPSTQKRSKWAHASSLLAHAALVHRALPIMMLSVIRPTPPCAFDLHADLPYNGNTYAGIEV